MKTAALACLAFASCAVEEVTVTESSKGGLTVTTTRKSRKPDAGVWTLAGAVVEGYAPRARVIREEKSGPITATEIANRWKP